MRRRALAVVPAVTAVVLVAVVVAVGGWWPNSRIETGDSEAHGATIVRYDLRSRLTGRSLPQVAAIPRGAGDERRPLLVFLHGRSDKGQESNVRSAFFAALDALGSRAPVVVFPSGGVEGSYWHDRASGRWGHYVLDEVIPDAVRRLHADPRRIAIGGISMGGFGAYDVARLAPSRFCAVGGHSAAMWLRGADTAPGAFDDAQDFARHDVVAIARARGRAAWGGVPLWLDGGSRDPFRTADEALAAALGIPLRTWPGAHESAYWDARFGAYLRFYASALARCRR